MSRFRNVVRTPVRALALAMALVLLASAAVVASSVIHLPKIITPKTAEQVTNIDILRSEIKNYYGTPGAATGAGSAMAPGGWVLPLNMTSNYAREAGSVARAGLRYLSSQKHYWWFSVPSTDHFHDKSGKKAIVLDVDDTTLTTWNYELYSNWDYNPGWNAEFVGLTGSTFTGNLFPATPGMVALVKHAHALGYAVFFITGRGDSQHDATLANLVNDAAGGYADVTTVDHLQTGLPVDMTDIDAGYPMPTAVQTGHGAAVNGGQTFADGLFTKPAVGDYPSYLDKTQFCADAIAASVSCSTIAYKSGTRAYIESLGYDIVANFGDQWSDLEGGYADRIFKMPNPNYYLP